MGLTFRDRPGPIRRFRVPIAILVIVLVAAGGVFYLVQSRPKPPGLPTSEADGFLAAWSQGDAKTMAGFVQSPPADLDTLATSLVQSAPGSKATYTRTKLVRNTHGTGATATYSAHVDLAGFGPLEWTHTLSFVRVTIGKKTGLAHPPRTGRPLPGSRRGPAPDAASGVADARASIIAADGSFLAGSQAIVKIGLEPDRIAKTLPKIKQLMQSLVGTQPSDIDAALNGPGVRPNYFVQIATVPDDARYATGAAPQARADLRRVLPAQPGCRDAARVRSARNSSAASARSRPSA